MSDATPTTDDRGQAYALEGITAALLVITAVTFAIGATAITPLTASTSNQQIEEQNRLLANDLLDATAEDESLHEFLDDWDGNERTNEIVTWGDDEEFDDGAFERQIYDVFNAGDRNIAYNMYVTYEDEEGEMVTEQVINQGAPSDHAAVGTRTVVLHDHELGGSGARHIPEMDSADEDSNVYNVVEVQLEVWRM